VQPVGGGVAASARHLPEANEFHRRLSGQPSGPAVLLWRSCHRRRGTTTFHDETGPKQLLEKAEGGKMEKVTYVRPAIERRDSVQGLLTNGSWKPGSFTAEQ
jgi:hypothetical protein